MTGVPPFDIRAYRDEDRDAVIALWRACELVRPWNDPHADIALCVRSPSAGLFVAGHVSGTAVGETGADTCADTDEIGTGALWATIMCGSDGHRGWLYYLAVDPARRRSGIARAMVRHAEQWLADAGIPKVELMIRPENEAVRQFYERVGYEVEPRLVMSRWLSEQHGRR